MAKVFQFTIAGLLDLEITVKNNDGRLARYLKRIGDGRDGKVDYTSSVAGDWKLCTAEEKKGVESVHELPVFFETRYFVRCEFDKSVTTAKINHRMASIEDAFDFSRQTMVGTLDFINAPGKFRFVIEYKRGGEWNSVVLEWMVVSEKMDVETDLQRITDVIKKASPALVHAFLAKTLTQTGVGIGGGKQDDNLWYSLFEKIFKEYKDAVETVVHRPHLKYVPNAEYLRAERIKRWTPALENRYLCMDGNRKEVALFRSERIDPETDTVENRFVLFTLRELARHLDQFADECSKHDTVADGFVKRLRGNAGELRALSVNPFFRGVGRFTGFRQESLALQRKPGYSRIYADWLILQQSLDPEGAKIEVGYRPISSLYEFWCFLVIRDRIAQSAEFKCEHPVPKIGSLDELGDIFDDREQEEDNNGASLNKIVYEFDEVNGGSRKLTLTYQQSYNTRDAGAFVYLNPQRPDIVLTLKDKTMPEGEGEYSYIFDAKYRIRPATDNVPDATTTEAIDAMHQYRDAILYRKQKGDKHLSREVIGAYVLYPGRPDPNSMDYSATIAAENIGAIPLLPSARDTAGNYVTDALGHHGEEKLNAFIDELIKRGSAAEHLGKNTEGYERVIPTRGTTVVLGEASGAVLGHMAVAQGFKGKLTEWVRQTGYFPLPKNLCEKPDSINVLVIPSTGNASLFKVKRLCTASGTINKADVETQFNQGKTSLHFDETYDRSSEQPNYIGYKEYDANGFYVWEVEEDKLKDSDAEQ